MLPGTHDESQVKSPCFHLVQRHRTNAVKPVKHLFGDVAVIWLISANAMLELGQVANDLLNSIEMALSGAHSKAGLSQNNL